MIFTIKIFGYNMIVKIKKEKRISMKKLLLLLVLGLTLIVGACSNTGEWDASSTISVFTRDTTSGTRAGFMEGIGFDDGADTDDVLVDGFVIKDNTGIISSVETDEYGIGYVSLASYDPDVVKGINFEGVEPSIQNVVNNTYALKRPFNFITRSEGDYKSQREEDIVEAFVAYMKTSDAADIITEEGAVPLAANDSWDDIKSNYPVCGLDNTGVIVSFGGSDSLEGIAMALSASFAPKCGNFTPEHNHTGSSDGYKRTQGEQKDSDNYKSIGFASRPFKDEEKTGAEDTRGQLAWDAIVVIVNKANEIDALTAEEIKKIYNGDFTTWDDLLS
jgi:phosphate transport system substrate-binding protein